MIFQDIIIRYVLDHWLSLRGKQVGLCVTSLVKYEKWNYEEPLARLVFPSITLVSVRRRFFSHHSDIINIYDAQYR